mmetsp:Transcript_4360/g.8096  ORF Transcript_4360/g.8096 Transcript_4360/m.8096 type:complete len:95 (-) Transcript_4360:193-477(-)
MWPTKAESVEAIPIRQKKETASGKPNESIAEHSCRMQKGCSSLSSSSASSLASSLAIDDEDNGNVSDESSSTRSPLSPSQSAPASGMARLCEVF